MLLIDYNGVAAEAGDRPIQHAAASALLLFARHFPNEEIGIATGRSYESILRRLEESRLLIPQMAVIIAEHGSLVFYPRENRVVPLVNNQEAVHHLKEEFLRYGTDGIQVDDKKYVFSVETNGVGPSPSEVDSIFNGIIKRDRLPLRVLTSGNFVEAVDSSLEDGYGQGKASAGDFYFQERGRSWSDVTYTGDGLNDYRSLEKAGLPACPSNAKPEIDELVRRRNGIPAPYPMSRGLLYIVENVVRLRTDGNRRYF